MLDWSHNVAGKRLQEMKLQESEETHCLTDSVVESLLHAFWMQPAISQTFVPAAVMANPEGSDTKTLDWSSNIELLVWSWSWPGSLGVGICGMSNFTDRGTLILPPVEADHIFHLPHPLQETMRLKFQVVVRKMKERGYAFLEKRIYNQVATGYCSSNIVMKLC